jgi:uncharacterized protein
MTVELTAVAAVVTPPLPRLLVDADACPVKEQVYRVARRYGLPTRLVANSWMRTPPLPGLELVLVGPGLDAADDWIVAHLEPLDVVLTADIPLAARVVAAGVACLDFRGEEFRPESIGEQLATRDLLRALRDQGESIGGPAAFSPRDRGRFAARLDEVVQRLLRRRPAVDKALPVSPGDC